MNQIVRRVQQPSAIEQSARELLPTKRHLSEGMFVESQLALGIEPRLALSWMVQPYFWGQGFTLLVFRSTSGLCDQRYPADLNRHGQLIIETTQDAAHEEHPGEGTHYYTFLLHKRGFLGLTEQMSVLRFSETVPSARIGIGRIKDKLELEAMLRRHEVSAIEHEAKLNEAEVRRIRSQRQLAETQGLKTRSGIEGVVAEELAGIDAMVETLLAKESKIAELKRDPRFSRLSRAEQKAVIKKIEERLDAGEISARREMRGS